MLGNIVVGLVLVLLVALAVRSIGRTQKSGGCSCGCAGCPGSKVCHPEQEK